MIKIANYLLTHYKGVYRIRCEYDKTKNQFPRKLDRTFEDIDCYIDCLNQVKVYYFGRSVLEAYIPSIGRGNNIIKAIKETFQGDIIFNIQHTDSEVLFHFHAKDMDKLAQFLKPKTSGASISPFSPKNLPRNKKYVIPSDELKAYKEIVDKLGKENIIALTHKTNAFIKSLVTKRNTWEQIKADMALKGLSGKNYIHSIGKWSNYISYLKKELSL